MEDETAEGTKKAKKQFYTIKKKVAETMEEAQKAEILQKACKETHTIIFQAGNIFLP